MLNLIDNLMNTIARDQSEPFYLITEPGLTTLKYLTVYTQDEFDAALATFAYYECLREDVVFEYQKIEFFHSLNRYSMSLYQFTCDNVRRKYA